MQTSLKQGANVEIDTRMMSATTRLVWHDDVGPGARAARPHTASARPCPSLPLPILSDRSTTMGLADGAEGRENKKKGKKAKKKPRNKNSIFVYRIYRCLLQPSRALVSISLRQVELLSGPRIN
jgi:hypothetical protein